MESLYWILQAALNSLKRIQNELAILGDIVGQTAVLTKRTVAVN